MNKLLLYTLLGVATLAPVQMAEAKRDRHDWKHGKHWRDRDRSRTIYVIENRRPVRRVVYVDDSGRYYRNYGGSRRYVSGRYFTSYPSRYYYADGRPRVGVSINF